jgi:hypothetical protein
VMKKCRVTRFGFLKRRTLLFLLAGGVESADTHAPTGGGDGGDGGVEPAVAQEIGSTCVYMCYRFLCHTKKPGME